MDQKSPPEIAAAERFGPLPSRQAATVALVINLARDRERRDAVLGQFAGLPGLQPEIVTGIYGTSLPDSVCEALVREKRWAKNKGTIGCFLSHVKAWEEVARISSRFAIVLEDDINVSALKHLPSLDLPADADIVFINDRMSPGDGLGAPIALPIARALRRLEAVRGGPGGDGYLLTPAGAAKLLAACGTDFYFGHVDGRLLRYASTEEDLATLPADSWIVGVVRHHRHPTLIPKLGLLKGYCLSVPLVRHLGVASIREVEDGKLPRASIPAQAAPAPVVEPPTNAAASLPIRYWNVVNNAGDQINPYIFERVAGVRPFFSPRRNEAHVLGVGSIMFMATPASHIWGSGILDPGGDLSQVSAANVHAVRGKLTRDLLRSKVHLTTDVPLGDPGIFADEIAEIVAYRKHAPIKRRIAVIPHHRMIGHPYIRDITRHPDADVINPQLDCIDFIKEIISSEIVLSQSLHGLVFAQLFGKPSAWFSHTLEDAWLFKFRDWFSTTIDPPAAPAFFGTPLDALLRSARLPGLAVDREALRSALPKVTTTERESGIGFRETRRLAPLSVHVTSDPRRPVSSNYDATVMCRSGDEATLQNALHAQARRFDDSFSLWLVFDPALFAAFSIGEMQRYRAMLDESPDTHYLSILAEGTRPAETGDWRGVVLVRGPYEFSFAARGQKVFRKAA